MLSRLSKLYHLMPHSDPCGPQCSKIWLLSGVKLGKSPKMHLPTSFFRPHGNSLLRKVMEALETQPSQDDATIWFHSMKPLTLTTKTRYKPLKKHGKPCRNDFQIQYRARCRLSACCCNMLACYFHVKDNQFVLGIAMLRCYAVFLRFELNSWTPRSHVWSAQASRWSEFRLSEFDLVAFDRPLPPKVLRQMAMCRCPAWFLYKKNVSSNQGFRNFNDCSGWPLRWRFCHSEDLGILVQTKTITHSNQP